MRIDITRVHPEWIVHGLFFIFSVLIYFWNLGAMGMAHDEINQCLDESAIFVGRGGFTCAGGHMSRSIVTI